MQTNQSILHSNVIAAAVSKVATPLRLPPSQIDMDSSHSTDTDKGASSASNNSSPLTSTVWQRRHSKGRSEYSTIALQPNMGPMMKLLNLRSYPSVSCIPHDHSIDDSISFHVFQCVHCLISYQCHQDTAPQSRSFIGWIPFLHRMVYKSQSPKHLSSHPVTATATAQQQHSEHGHG